MIPHSHGVSEELRYRSVRIYQPTRNTMQSGAAKSERWRIDWDTLPGAGRWENPLMGYASSSVDPLTFHVAVSQYLLNAEPTTCRERASLSEARKMPFTLQRNKVDLLLFVR